MYRYLILALFLAGCASSGGTFARPANLIDPSPARYPFAYSDPYVNLFWNCATPKAGGAAVDGYGTTSMNANVPLRNFNVVLSAHDAEGKRLTERDAWGDDLSPGRFDPVPFEVSVPAVSGTARYDLYYDFQYRDGFTIQDQFATVKDVCSAKWQRKAKPAGY